MYEFMRSFWINLIECRGLAPLSFFQMDNVFLKVLKCFVCTLIGAINLVSPANVNVYTMVHC